MSDHIFAMSNSVKSIEGIMAAIGREDDLTARSVKITSDKVMYGDLNVVEASIQPDLPEGYGSGVLHIAMGDEARQWIEQKEKAANPSPMDKIYKMVADEMAKPNN